MKLTSRFLLCSVITDVLKIIVSSATAGIAYFYSAMLVKDTLLAQKLRYARVCARKMEFFNQLEREATTAIDDKNTDFSCQITRLNAHKAVGKSAYWFCKSCRAWHTSSISDSVVITCPVCGANVDLSCTETQAYISFQDRRQLVDELCATGSEWEIEHQAAVDRFGDFITDAYAGRLNKRAKNSGYRHFAEKREEVEAMADFLLGAREIPIAKSELPPVYSEETLQKKYQDSRREHNVSSLSSLNLVADGDDDNRSGDELAEAVSLKNGYGGQSFDSSFCLNDFCSGLDHEQRGIVDLLHEGFTKTAAAAVLNLSEQQLKTRIKHIGAVVKNNL